MQVLSYMVLCIGVQEWRPGQLAGPWAEGEGDGGRHGSGSTSRDQGTKNIASGKGSVSRQFEGYLAVCH